MTKAVSASPAGAPERDKRGLFLPGNKIGRQRSERQTQLMQEYIEPHRQALLDRLLKHAAGEDQTAAVRATVWLLERLGGPIEAQTVLPPIPGLAEARSPADKARAIVSAVARGEVSAEAADKVLGAIAKATAIVQATEF